MSKAEEYLKEKYQLSMKMNQFSPALVVKIMNDFADQKHQSRVNAKSDMTEYKDFILKWGFERGQPLFADITEDLNKLLNK